MVLGVESISTPLAPGRFEKILGKVVDKLSGLCYNNAKR